MSSKVSVWAFMAVRVAVGIVFTVSGFTKLVHPVSEFTAVIESYDIVHGALAELGAHVMPWAEFIFGLFLTIGIWTPVSVVVLWAMNSLFIVVLSTVLIRRLPVGSCGCFGESITLTPAQTLILDGVIWVLFAVMTYFPKKTRTLGLDGLFDRR